jgi:hypothetical protein
MIDRRTIALEVCGNDAVCLASHNDLPEGAIDDSFFRDERHTATRGKHCSATTIIIFHGLGQAITTKGAPSLRLFCELSPDDRF